MEQEEQVPPTPQTMASLLQDHSEPKMEDAIMTMVTTFNEEAKGQQSLKWNRFHQLVKKHLGLILTNVDDGEALKRRMNRTDDSNVSFQEYLNLVGAVAQQMSKETLKRQRGDMEGAIKTVVGQFLTAARGKDSLDKKSFQKFLNKNLANVLTNTGNATAVDRLIKRMDDNDDGKVSFQEYLGLIGAVAKAFSDNKGAQNSATN